MYQCQIHVFEPVAEFASWIEKRFSRNHKIIIHRFGLADRTKRVSIGLRGDSSSIYVKDNHSEEIQLVGASDHFQNKNFLRVDLMKINIEGAEFDLFDHLIESGLATRINNIQVQFHNFVDDADKRMAIIQLQLKATHFIIYSYPYIWENWERKVVHRANGEE